MANPTNMHEVAKANIITRQHWPHAGRLGTAREFALGEAHRAGVDIPTWEPRGAAVSAIVNAGRWLVRCPDCAGAEYADPDDPLFWCASCFNVANGGYPRPVGWPRDRGRIEAELLRRPAPLLPGHPSPRNWEAHETADDLRRENQGRGIK